MKQPVSEFEQILGYPVTLRDKRACIAKVTRWLDEPGRAKFFACANPHSIQVAETDSVFKEALMSADLLTPDGVGIVMASRLLGGHITERVTGSNIFMDLSAALDAAGGRSYFFLGSSEEALGRIRVKMAEDYSNIAVAGTYSPPYTSEFRAEDNDAMIAAVNAARADVLWVGLTAPKQEKWIYRHLDRLDVGVVGAIGAVFDFYSGKIKRSPEAFQRLGLEWLPRLVQQPRRLWRRNFVSAPGFMIRVMRHKVLGDS